MESSPKAHSACRSTIGRSWANLIERSQYNKRRKRLFGLAEKIRVLLASKFTEFEDYFIVDSMPLEICKVARQNRVKNCSRYYETAPAKGFCASQNTWFYGYKLHGVCSVSGVFHLTFMILVF